MSPFEIFTLAWGLVALLCFRPLFRALIADVLEVRAPTWVDVVAHINGTIITVAVLAPLVALALIVTRRTTPAGFIRRVGGESRDQKIRRLEDERTARDRHIHELERELRIGSHGG